MKYKPTGVQMLGGVSVHRLFNLSQIDSLVVNSGSRAAERIFMGGGGAKTKKGTIMSKRALTVHMQIISLMTLY